MGYKPFLIRQTLDDEGVPLPDKESNRFVKARPGDMLMCPFQCEVCHFRNIMKRDPMTDYSKDFEIMEYMRRANLDAFWARESSTVTKNLALLLRAESCFGRLDLPPAVSLMGPFPLSDTLGMQAAIAVLDKSLDKGKYEAFVQWETFRKMRSAITNLHQARVDGMGDVVMSYEKEKLWVSTVQTHTFYFSRFMTGLHKRVGEVVKQDWPVPIEVMQYIDRNLNRLWNQEADPAARKCIAEMGTWFVGGFCTGLRGEEMLLIELRGTADSLQFLTLEVDPHFLFRMKGRTKGCLLAGKGFDMPCLAVTGVSKLKPGRWIRRLVTIIENGGRRNGKLFLRDLQVARLVEFEEDFFDVLLSVQSSTELIDKGLDLREKAGILRTLRRGLTSHAINMEVPTTLTEAINRWRNEHKENGAVVTYKTIDHYAQLDTLKPTFLKFSKAL